MFYWVMKHVLVGPLLRLAYRPWVEGRKNVPRRGAAILAGNHLAVIDSFLLPLMLPRQVKFLGKSDYFTGKGLKGRITAWFMTGIGTIPVDRAGGAASEAAISTGVRVLREGDLLGIYPEGTRSPDGRLYKAKTGVARMALETGVPVIPVVMVGTDEAQPAGRVVPRFMPLGARIGEPLDFSHLAGKAGDHATLRRVADEIMEAILALSDQEYVDVYAATEKSATAAGREPTPATRYLPTQRPAS
ncbi:lysophospholipid acyltransferase family protein [Myceligenerans crystallogenes]|uniref:Lysophospholipid acyltransferase family protein n=1 Tax=Myceligenerans crystallogenes TaxID=316335 RepID=A0ABP4ZQH8_9MICO